MKTCLFKIYVLLAFFIGPVFGSAAPMHGHSSAVTSASRLEGERAIKRTGRMVEYDLEISEQSVAPAGRRIRALTINGGIPGPTLRFHEGDWAVIRVHNRLAHDETSLHWHGLLVPNDQDGVPHLTTPPILAGTTFTYEFPVRQIGTYWFHSHTGLQEQQAVYGSIVIEPRAGESEFSDVDEVVVLSDWTNERPEEVLRTLKRGSNWYGIQKGTAQSWLGALKVGALGEYLRREKTRMPPMDVSDVAYDAFLWNGVRRFQIAGKPGQTVRLRVINASAATYFYVESAAGPLELVAADGPPVEPTRVQRLLIGIAETYDLRVRVPDSGAWEIRATAQDGSGYASGVLGEGMFHASRDVPRPDLYRMDEMLMAAVEESELGDSSISSQHQHEMPPAMKQTAEEPRERPLSPYRSLRSKAPTSLRTGAPRRKMILRMTGDMQRYIWSFNGKTVDEDGIIPVKKGEVLSMELVNDTMMHHPIHLHGHFFRLLNGQGDYAPLKHTVDVPPMGRRIVEFEANEEGDWMFHCHVLYHMMEGMARVVHYERSGDTGVSRPVAMGEHAMPMRYAFVDLTVRSNQSEGSVRGMSGRNSLLWNWDVGRERGLSSWKYEHALLYEWYENPNLGLIGGARLSNHEPSGNRAVAGGWYRLPYLILATATVDSGGGLRLELGKSFQLTPRINLETRGRYDAREHFEGAASLQYAVGKKLSLSVGYHTAYGVGAGLGFHF